MEARRYTGVAIVLHWTIALLTIFNLSLCFFMEGFAPAYKGVIVPPHIGAALKHQFLDGEPELSRMGIG